MSNDRPEWIDPFLRGRLLKHLEERRRKGATLEALGRAAGDGLDESEIRRALEDLSRTGEAVEWSRRWYAIPFVDLAVGTLKVLERGDAVVRTGSGGEAGLFVRRRDLKGARTGDLVLLKRSKGRTRQGSPQRLPEATVVRVLNRPHDSLVGSVATENKRRVLIPFDPKLDLVVELEAAASIEDGIFVVVAQHDLHIDIRLLG